MNLTGSADVRAATIAALLAVLFEKQAPGEVELIVMPRFGVATLTLKSGFKVSIEVEETA